MAVTKIKIPIDCPWKKYESDLELSLNNTATNYLNLSLYTVVISFLFIIHYLDKMTKPINKIKTNNRNSLKCFMDNIRVIYFYNEEYTEKRVCI